jgi:hypothetical protein
MENEKFIPNGLAIVNGKSLEAVMILLQACWQ